MSAGRALVSGGSGFVGRRFVRRLLADGYDVVIVDDLSTGLPLDRWPAHLRLSEAERSRTTMNVADFRDWARTTSDRFDLVVHLAAVVGGRMVIDGDPLKVATDLGIDATLFNWIVKQRPLPKKVLYFSSSAVYPIDEQTAERNRPLSEDMVDFGPRLGLPDMTYGWSKLTGELLAKHAVEKYDLDVVVYRPFSGYGEDQDFTYPFPSIIRRVGNKESPIVVWGSGDQLRDFIYIDDVVDAVFTSAPQMRPGEALNLGSGVGTSFRELALLAGKVLGHRAEVVNDATKPEGVFARVANAERMLKHFRPRVSLERGIGIVHDFQRTS